MSDQLFSFQGHVLLAERDANGAPLKFFHVGDASECNLALATESTASTESRSGNRLQNGELDRAKTATLTLTLKTWKPKNLALGLYSEPLSSIAGSVTGEVFPSGLVAGDFVRLARPFASNLVITDSAGTPATLPPANYRLGEHAGSVVELFNVGALTQPFKGAYDYAAANSLAMFTRRPAERFFLLDGINTAEDGQPVLVELYRAKFKPISNLGLINTEYGTLQLEGAVLYDSTRALDDKLGGFGRILEKVAA